MQCDLGLKRDQHITMPDSPGASTVGGGVEALRLDLHTARAALAEQQAEQLAKKKRSETWEGDVGKVREYQLVYQVRVNDGHLPRKGGSLAKKFLQVKNDLEKAPCFVGHPGLDAGTYQKKWERLRDAFKSC